MDQENKNVVDLGQLKLFYGKGAQNRMFEYSEKEGLPVHFRTSIPEMAIDFAYSCCRNQRVLADYCKSNATGNRYVMELLSGPTRFYCDLDGDNVSLAISNQEFVSLWNDIFSECFDKYLGIHFKRSKMLWSCSSRKDKISFHGVYAGDFFFTSEQRDSDLRNFAKLVYDFVMHSDRFIQAQFTVAGEGGSVIQKCFLDCSVYTKNRLFRTIGSTKCGKNSFLVPIGETLDSINETIVQNHFVSVLQTGELTQFKLDERYTIPENPQPKTCLSFLERLVNEKLKGCKLGKTQVVKNNCIYLENAGPSRKCLLTGCIHNSNRGYLHLKPDGIYFKCFSKKCTGQSKKLSENENQSKTYRFYNDLDKLNALYKKIGDKFSEDHIRQYLQDTVVMVDNPSTKAVFITRSQTESADFPQSSLKVWETTNHRNTKLFSGFNNLKFTVAGQKKKKKSLSMEDVLYEIATTRNLPVYRDFCWMPFLKGGDRHFLPKTTYNTWAGFPLETVQIKTPKCFRFEDTKVFELFRLAMCKDHEESYTFLRNYIAHKLQMPWKKIPVSILFCNSPMGAGKGGFANFLSQLFSSKYLISYSNTNQITSQFNAEREECLFLVLEELTDSGVLFKMDALIKELISQTKQLLEKKGQDRTVGYNHAQVLMFSNEFRTCRIMPGDRRFCVIQNSNCKKHDVTFWLDLYSEIRDPEIMKSIFDYFAGLDLTNWNYRNLPQTELRQKIIQSCESAMMRFLRFIFSEIAVWENKSVYTRFHCNESGERESLSMRPACLYEMYLDWINCCCVKNKMERTHFLKTFEIKLQTSVVRKFLSFHLETKRITCYYFTMNELQTKLNNYFGGDFQIQLEN